MSGKLKKKITQMTISSNTGMLTVVANKYVRNYLNDKDIEEFGTSPVAENESKYNFVRV